MDQPPPLVDGYKLLSQCFWSCLHDPDEFKILSRLLAGRSQTTNLSSDLWPFKTLSYQKPKAGAQDDCRASC